MTKSMKKTIKGTILSAIILVAIALWNFYYDGGFVILMSIVSLNVLLQLVKEIYKNYKETGSILDKGIE